MSTDRSLTVQKAISLLALISEQNHPIKLNEISKSSGIGKTVCLRMLSTLEYEGLIARDVQSGGYITGIRLIEFAGRALTGDSLRRVSGPVMDELARSTGDSIILFVRSKRLAMCIERRDGDAPVRAAGVDIGRGLYLHTGGAPFSLLSFLPESEQQAYLSEPLVKSTSQTILNPITLKHNIAKVQMDGYSIGDEDAIEHVVAVGAPLFGHEGRLLGALSVGGVKPRYTPERIQAMVGVVTEAAEKISAMMGGAGETLRWQKKYAAKHESLLAADIDEATK